jgi:integrase
VSAIIKLDRYFEKPEKKTGVIRKPGSKNLYVDLRPHGIRIQKSSGLKDTLENRNTLQVWVDRQNERIKKGAFKFSEAFPNAPEKEKAIHAALEGREYKPKTGNMLFKDYAEGWMEKNFKGFPQSRVKDYSDIIKYRILPFFENKTFIQINGVVLKDFIGTLSWKDGKKIGQPLSASRVSNILIVLRAIWNDAVEEYQWERSDPFVFIKRFLSKELKKRPQKGAPQVFRFDEWVKVIRNIDPHHRPVAEFMIMTGMIGSEIAGLKKSAIKEDRICINNSIVRNHEKAQLKTEYRKRDIPMTEVLKKIIDSVVDRPDSEYVFTTKNGRCFDVDSFRKNAWTTALKKTGVEYRVPYTTRHTFAAWSLTLKMDPNKLVSLMGHGSKKMVYEVYGKYVEDLETDAGKIFEYFGNDFNPLQSKKALSFT